ncbi:FAD-dependent oxidoreductase [Streptomyces sp. NPDC018045]|uniref:FAD-dependent oxidoreductase n=1 Tax=Streptomyces sp. NPDC018045 TaxID=3365037 RepID=UPI0037900D7C
MADLVRGFHERFPSLGDVAPQRARGGWAAMTPSLLPVAGEATKNVFYAIGCNGHGLARSPYLGTPIADRLAGDQMHEDLAAVWLDVRQGIRAHPTAAHRRPPSVIGVDVRAGARIGAAAGHGDGADLDQ